MPDAQWTQQEIRAALDYNTLITRLEAINAPALAKITGDLLDEALSDPAVQADDPSMPVGVLDKISTGQPVNGVSPDDHRTTMLVLKTLASTIVLLHMAELSRAEDPATHTRPVRKVIFGHVDQASGDHQDVFSVKIRNSKAPVIKIPFSCHLDPYDLVYSTLLASDVRAPKSGPSGLLDGRLVYSKMILELLALDDHGPDSIRKYVASQHVWVLASMAGTTIEYMKTSPVVSRALISAFASLLLQGRDVHGDGKTETVPLLGDVRSDEDLHQNISIVQMALMSCRVMRSDWYDAPAIESSTIRCGLGAVHGSFRLHVYESIVKHQDDVHPYSVLTYFDSAQMRSGKTQLAGVDTVCRHQLKGLSYGGDFGRDIQGRKWWNEDPIDEALVPDACRKIYTLGLPDSIRTKITRDRVMDLQRRTRFISAYLTESNLGGRIYDMLDSALGDRLGRPIREELVEDLDANDHLRGFKNKLLTSFMIPQLDIMDGDPTGEDEGTGRMEAFVEAYTIHQMVRFHETVVDANGEDGVDPLDVLIATDVLNGIRRAYMDGTITMLDRSSLYGNLTDACLRFKNVLDALKDLDEDPMGSGAGQPFGPYNEPDSGLQDVSTAYGMMMHDGEAKRLEGVLEKLDAALIGLIVDHYVDYELKGSGADGGSSDAGMPEEFMREALRMEAMSSYDEALAPLA